MHHGVIIKFEIDFFPDPFVGPTDNEIHERSELLEIEKA